MGVDVNYFLDEMGSTEIESLLEQNHQNHREEWERLRIQCYYSVIPHVKKNSIHDIKSFMPFQWDNQPSEVDQEVSHESTRERFNQICESLKDKGVI